MPKIEVYREAFTRLLREPTITDDQLEAIFPFAKAELDEPANADGVMKIELNDTNRPDLWSSAGLARALNLARGAQTPRYPFFSDATVRRESGSRRVVVDRSVEAVRPYIVAFVMRGPAVTEAVLKDLIQTQEKLTWNYGRKRKSVAMGLYRNDLISYPVHYHAADPDRTRFVPLAGDTEMSLREICRTHPKGVEFGHIIADEAAYPLLTDDNGEVLSLPPVINSAHLGAVQVGDTELFVELTGTDLDSLLLVASIVACDVSDAGYTVDPVCVSYPYETSYGREITVPYYFQKPQCARLATINRLLGTDLTEQEVLAALSRMGVVATAAGASAHTEQEIVVRVPEYRNDFLHAVDIVEDVMVGRGMGSFEPTMPTSFTMGRLTAVEELSRRLKSTMVGLGFQEMIFNYLGSATDYIERMYPAERRAEAIAEAVQIANPMSENYEFVRPSIIPSLLSAEAVSAQAVYPHHIFEIGQTAGRDEREVSGTVTRTVLGFVSADREVGYNLINSHISAILYYMGRNYTLQETSDARFIDGRAARIIADDQRILGVFGELHPRVLDAWGIQVPCTAGELDLSALVGTDDGSSDAT